jgi:hypothetical protein
MRLTSGSEMQIAVARSVTGVLLREFEFMNPKNLVGAALLALSLAACGQKEATTDTGEAPPAKPLVSGIDVSQLDSQIHPGDDFFWPCEWQMA